MSEAERIQQEYQRRSREIPRDIYSPVKTPSALFLQQQRTRGMLHLLRKTGHAPTPETRVFDVGCGNGNMLLEFESWGVRRENLAGVDLVPERADIAKQRLCEWRSETGNVLAEGADIRCADASALPWSDESFDIVLQSTVFTSILDDEMKAAIAREMARILAPGGCVLWYDFIYDNPKNPNVRGVGKKEIRRLFPDFRCHFRSVTLAPPIARRLVPLSWTCALMLESLRIFNTHVIGVFEKPS